MKEATQTKSVSSRDASIDIAKGIAILLVIVGHVKQTPLPLKVWLYTFHMPLFFLCSGMVFSLRRYPTFALFVKSRLRSLVWPYFCLSVALWLLTRARAAVLLSMFESGDGAIWDPQGSFLSILLGYRLHHHYFSMWFLTCLFCAELAFYPIVRCCKACWRPYVAISVVGVLVQWIIMRLVKGWFWSIDLVPIALAFVSLGYALRSVPVSLEWVYRLRMLPLAISINGVCGYCNYQQGGFPDLFSCGMGNPILYLLAATAGCWSVLILAKHLKRAPFLTYLGRNTLAIYAFQNSLLIPIAEDIVSRMIEVLPALPLEQVRWIIVAALTVLMSVAIVELVNRCFPWMLGRFSPKGALSSNADASSRRSAS